MTSTTTGTRFLGVDFTGEYGVHKVLAGVWSCDNDGSETRRECDWRSLVQSGPFRGEEIDDLELSAYVRTASEMRDGDRPIWGEKVAFGGHSIELRDAQRMVRVLSTIERKLQRLNDQDGYPSDFADWLIRLAKILGCTRIRIRRTAGHNRAFGPMLKLTDGAAQVEAAAARWAEGAHLTELVA